jgi:hypothetical protein
MTPSLSATETARILALLDRLDPPATTCAVAGCLHGHRTHPRPREEAPAIAA